MPHSRAWPGLRAAQMRDPAGPTGPRPAGTGVLSPIGPEWRNRRRSAHREDPPDTSLAEGPLAQAGAIRARERSSGAGSCPPSRVSRRGRWVPGRCIGGRLPWRHGGRISAPPAPCVRKPERVRPADRGERDDGRRGSIRRRESGTPSVQLSASSPFHVVHGYAHQVAVHPGALQRGQFGRVHEDADSARHSCVAPDLEYASDEYLAIPVVGVRDPYVMHGTPTEDVPQSLRKRGADDGFRASRIVLERLVERIIEVHRKTSVIA